MASPVSLQATGSDASGIVRSQDRHPEALLPVCPSPGQRSGIDCKWPGLCYQLDHCCSDNTRRISNAISKSFGLSVLSSSTIRSLLFWNALYY